MEELLRKAIAEDESEMTELTKNLIAIPTENPPGTAYRACADLIAGKLGEIGLPCTLLEVPADRPGQELPGYCLLSSYGAGPDVLYFHGHYDVVPASSRAQLQPHVKGGNLFGRGSSDMKSGLAAMIAAVKAIKACGVELRGKIGLTIVPDEETGGWRGSRYLEETGLLGQHGIGMLTPEPTGGLVWNANRGALSLRVTLKGKPAHVGLHYQGVNAFERMLRVTDALLDLRREVAGRHTRFNITPEAARASILMMGGECTGGTSFNLVPAECTFTVDRRINPEEDLAEEKSAAARPVRADQAAGRRPRGRGSPGGSLGGSGRRGSRGDGAGPLHRGGHRDARGLRDVPGPAGEPLVRATWRPGVRLRPGAADGVPRPARVRAAEEHPGLRPHLRDDRGPVARSALRSSSAPTAPRWSSGCPGRSRSSCRPYFPR